MSNNEDPAEQKNKINLKKKEKHHRFISVLAVGLLTLGKASSHVVYVLK